MKSIYPLAVFILVALNKMNYSRDVHVVRNEAPKTRDGAVTVTFEVAVERSTEQCRGLAQPMLPESSGTDRSNMNEMKVPSPVTYPESV